MRHLDGGALGQSKRVPLERRFGMIVLDQQHRERSRRRRRPAEMSRVDHGLANAAPAPDLVIDLSGVRQINSSNLSQLLRLRKLARTRPPFQLAISLHTPFDEERDELVPAMKGTPIEEVLAAGDDWFEVTGREITYEYALLGGRNDSTEHAERLAERLRGRRATVGAGAAKWAISLRFLPYSRHPGPVTLTLGKLDNRDLSETLFRFCARSAVCVNVVSGC